MLNKDEWKEKEIKKLKKLKIKLKKSNKVFVFVGEKVREALWGREEALFGQNG